MQKYIEEEKLQNLCDMNEISTFEPSSNDTINEEALLESLKRTGRVEELFHATAQMAIVGYGGKSFNKYKYKGTERELRKLFDETRVNYKASNQANLKEGELTPRRLLRIFRVQVHKLLIERTDLSSYLYRKYSRDVENKNESFREVCFPGAENLINNSKDAKDLLLCYKKLDNDLEKLGKSSGISERIERVFLARNIL